MGRCSFNSRPRFYTFIPTFSEADPGLGNSGDTIPHFIPLRHDPAQVHSPGVRTGSGTRSIHGMLMSATQFTNVSGTAVINMVSGSSVQSTSVDGTYSPATKTHLIGRYRPGLHLLEAATAKEGFCNEHLNLDGFLASMGGLRFIAGGGADLVENLAGVGIYSHDSWDNLGASGNDTLRPKGGSTHDRGPVAGGLTVFPIPPVNSHTAASTVREIQAPMGMRVHGVTFMHDGSGAGNGLKLQVRRNAVLTDLTPVVTLTGAGFEAKEVLPVGGDAQFDSTNNTVRTLERDDELVLVKSGGNGMTSPMAFLVCTPLEHYNEQDFRRDLDITLPADATSLRDRNHHRSWAQHSRVSGPATGGIAFIPLGQIDALASQADVVHATVPMPFDGEVVGFVMSNREHIAAGDGHRITLRNATTAKTIVSLDDMYYYGHYYYYYAGQLLATWNGAGYAAPAIAPPTISPGDEAFSAGDSMEVRVTTGVGETIDKGLAGIYARVTGFPAHRATLD